MENKCPVKGKIAYLASLALRAESAIFGSGCGSLGALEQHLPDLFVRSVEEPIQSLVLRRIELPHIEPRRWHRRIWRMSMTWTMLTSLSFLFIIFWMQVWSLVSSTGLPQGRPFSFQEVSRMGIPDRNSGAATQLVSRGSVM